MSWDIKVKIPEDTKTKNQGIYVGNLFWSRIIVS